MARPRKDDSVKAKRREISATDTAWEAAKTEAKEAGMSVSRFLLNQPRTRVVSAETIIRQLETITDIHVQMARIAQGLTDNKLSCAPAILLEMIAIERWLAALVREAGRT